MRFVILAALLTTAVGMPAFAAAPLAKVDPNMPTPLEQAALTRITKDCANALLATLKEAKDRAVTAHSPMGYYFMTPDGKVTQVSQPLFVNAMLADCISQQGRKDPFLQRPLMQQVLLEFVTH